MNRFEGSPRTAPNQRNIMALLAHEITTGKRVDLGGAVDSRGAQVIKARVHGMQAKDPDQFMRLLEEGDAILFGNEAQETAPLASPLERFRERAMTLLSAIPPNQDEIDELEQDLDKEVETARGQFEDEGGVRDAMDLTREFASLLTEINSGKIPEYAYDQLDQHRAFALNTGWSELHQLIDSAEDECLITEETQEIPKAEMDQAVKEASTEDPFGPNVIFKGETRRLSSLNAKERAEYDANRTAFSLEDLRGEVARLAERYGFDPNKFFNR